MRAKQTSSPVPVRTAKKGSLSGLPATVEHTTPVRANTKTDDSANVRDPRPSIPSKISHVDDQQIARLKTFKHSRPMFREEEKYTRPLTTHAACDDIKGWSPAGQREDP